MRSRILWLAVADARGHLMRAYVMRSLAESIGVRIDVLTTSDEGVRFLAALGTPAALLSRGYAIEFDDQQNMARRRTEARIIKYLLRPAGFRRDLERIEELAEGAAFVVNDFHPALLIEPRRLRVVHLYGENMWGAIEDHFLGRGPRELDRRYRSYLRARRDRGFACIEHALITPERRQLSHPVYRLPPIVPALSRSREETRAELRVPIGGQLAVVYLNPHFRDPALASVLEESFERRGLHFYGVGEGFAGRPGWRARDPHLADAIAACDVFVSAPGMGALGQAFIHARPMIALVTDQPEQQQNLAAYRGRLALTPVPLADLAHFEDALVQSLGDGPSTEPRVDRVARVHGAWLEAIAELKERSDDLKKTHHRIGARDQQHPR